MLTSHSVSITEVRMSPDLRHATVFVKPLLGADEADVLIRALPAQTEASQKETFRQAVGRAHAQHQLDSPETQRQLEDLPLPYRFDVHALAAITHAPLLEHISRVGQVIYRSGVQP